MEQFSLLNDLLCWLIDWLELILPFVMVGRLAGEDELISTELADCLAGADVPGESSVLARDTVADGSVDGDRIRLNGGPLNRSSTLRGSGRQGTSDLLKFSYVFIILSRLVSRKGWYSSVTPDLDPSVPSKIQCYVFSFKASYLIYYLMKSIWTP